MAGGGCGGGRGVEDMGWVGEGEAETLGLGERVRRIEDGWQGVDVREVGELRLWGG